MVKFGSDADRLRELARRKNGQFGEHDRSSPDITLGDSEYPPDIVELSEEVPQLHGKVVAAALWHIETAMPVDIDSAFFDFSEEGAYLEVAETFDGNGDEAPLVQRVAYEIDYALQVMGEPDADYDGSLVERSSGGYGWERDYDSTRTGDARSYEQLCEIVEEWASTVNTMQERIHTWHTLRITDGLMAPGD